MAGLHRRLSLGLLVCLAAATPLRSAEEPLDQYPLSIRILQTEQIPYSDQVSGGGVSASCWFSESRTTMRMSCSRTEIPPIYWPKTRQVILVEASDGNAYILTCNRSSRWSKCRFLVAGSVLQARWKDNGLTIAYYSGKQSKLTEANYEVLRSAVLESRNMADLGRGLQPQGDGNQAPPEDTSGYERGADSSRGDRVIKAWWPEQQRPAAPGSLGVSAKDGAAGVVLTEVISGGPADRAGLRVGDTIVAVDNKPFSKVAALGAEIQGRAPGSEIRIAYLRGDLKIETQVTLAAGAVKP